LKIKNRMHRTVIISNHVTIKFPRLLSPWKRLKYFFTKRREVAWIEIRTMIRTFLEGFRENLNEFLCWRENKAAFLMPVYFCIGIIEIQKTSHLKEISEDEIDQIWVSLIKLAKQEVWDTDHHNLASPANYHKEGNQFKLIDYGGQGMRQFIRKYRQELEKIFSSQT